MSTTAPAGVSGRILPEYEQVEIGDLREAVHQALGAASVCWEPMDGRGVFMSERAEQIGGELLEIIARWASTRDTVAVPPAGASPVHLGEYARVDIMGHDWRIGWVSDGSMAGAACLDVRDGAGRLVAKIPPHTVYLYTPLNPPQPGEERAALPAAIEDSEAALDDLEYDDVGRPF